MFSDKYWSDSILANIMSTNREVTDLGKTDESHWTLNVHWSSLIYLGLSYWGVRLLYQIKRNSPVSYGCLKWSSHVLNRVDMDISIGCLLNVPYGLGWTLMRLRLSDDVLNGTLMDIIASKLGHPSDVCWTSIMNLDKIRWNFLRSSGVRAKLTGYGF